MALAVGLGAALAWAVTPWARRLAQWANLLDRPKERGVHEAPMPYLGGLALLFAFACAWAVFAPADAKLWGVLVAAAFMAAIGVVDDACDLPWWLKLLMMAGAGVILTRFGIVIERITNPFGPGYIEFGRWGVVTTVVWTVAVITSINVIDGLDGLAAGVSAIAGATLAVLALLYLSAGRYLNLRPTDLELVAVGGAAVAGACLGFLRWNFNPAKIFMGDAGAQMLGVVLAALSVISLFKTALLSIVPIFALGYAIVDTTWAVLRRVAAGKSAFCADKDHLHHRLLARGLSQRQAVLLLYAVSAALAGLALWLGKPA